MGLGSAWGLQGRQQGSPRPKGEGPRASRVPLVPGLGAEALTTSGSLLLLLSEGLQLGRDSWPPTSCLSRSCCRPSAAMRETLREPEKRRDRHPETQRLTPKEVPRGCGGRELGGERSGPSWPRAGPGPSA